ncbi:MAG TPA: protein kinase [Clostridiaceae bacterium]|nr:protein kinase [Clostridiaceae bacterium]
MRPKEILEGKYRIIKTLGRGGMGQVYLAENIRLGTLWAVKKIDRQSGGKASLPAEPDILRKLNHPALPRVFDILEDSDSIYIIFDYIEGTSLDKKLEEVGHFPEEVVLEWACQLCDVLSYLHSFKPSPIIYRDMKPSNIILTPEGQIKLIDFGTAREYKEGAESDTTYIGTRGYAAPEQYGCGQTDVASDIYSLGMTLRHLLTGKGPGEFLGNTGHAMTSGMKMSCGMEKIVNKCTMQNPCDRYQSAAELKKDIESLRIMDTESERSGNYDKVESYNKKGSWKLAKDSVGENDGNGGSYGKRADDGSERYERSFGTFTMRGGFRKVILTVWDNAEFGCELAYVAARFTDLNVALIDLDLLSPKVDLILNINKYPFKVFTEGLFNKSSIDIIMDALEKNTLTQEVFMKSAIRRKELKNLFVITGNYNLNNYEYYSDDSLIKLIEKACQYFDLVVLLVNKSIYDSYTVISLIKSDYNLIAVRADADNLREFNRYLLFLEEKQQIPLNKCKFVAYEYDKNFNIDKKALEEITGGNYLGSISYSSKRARYRNCSSPYAKHMEKEVISEYFEILSKFNIVPRPSFFSILRNRLFREGEKNTKKEVYKHACSSHTQ